VAVLDVGGGSSELAIGIPARARIAGEVERTLSREIGAVRLSERHPLLLGARALEAPERAEVEGAARADAAAVLAPFADVRGFAHLVAVGGTAFTAAAMVADGVHDGAVLTRADCARIVDDLLGRDLESRRRVARIRPQRADILPAGLIVIDEACRLLGVDAVTVSESDLLQGYLSSPAFRAVPLAPESPRASRTEAAG
jgi:exopolyphosphatase/guanosine-5'-triphosphate,3'-diphosphate pyrophosphatase